MEQLKSNSKYLFNLYSRNFLFIRRHPWHFTPKLKMKRVILILHIETSEWEKKILFADTSYSVFLYYTFAFCVCLWVRLSTISNSMIFCLCVCQLQRPMLFYLQSLPQWFSICLSVTTGKRRDRKPFKEDCWQSFVTDRMDGKSFRGRLLMD